MWDPQKIIRVSFYSLFTLTPIVFLPFTSELFEFNKMLLVYLFTAIIVSAWTYASISAKKFIFTNSLLTIPIILFLLGQLLSLFFSIDPQMSFFGYYGRLNGGLLSLICYSILYFAFVTWMDSKSTQNLLKVLILSSIAVGIYGCLQAMGIDAHLWVQDVKNRVFSFIGQPNWLASFIVAIIFIPLSKPTLKNYAIFILLILTLVLTKSRSGLLGFAIGFAIFSILIGLKSHAKHLILTFCISLIFVFSIPNPIRDILIKPQNIKSLTMTTPQEKNPEGGTESGAIRQIVWKGALNVWLQNPKTILLGTGPETFAISYYQKRPLEHNYTSEWELLYNKAHNEFLNYLSNTGILGFTTYLILLIFGLYQTKSQLALFAGLIAISVTHFFGFSIVISNLFLFIFPAIATTLSKSQNPISTPNNSNIKNLIIPIVIFTISLILIIQYFRADLLYASGQKNFRIFTATSEPEYLVSAFEDFSKAVQIVSFEPGFRSELGLASAYIAILTQADSPEYADALRQAAQNEAQSAVSLSPSSPSILKSAARIYLILGSVWSEDLTKADEYIVKAISQSPTDPRLPYTRSIISMYQNATDSAKMFLSQSLKLKPDFAEAQKKLNDLLLSTSSSKVK